MKYTLLLTLLTFSGLNCFANSMDGAFSGKITFLDITTSEGSKSISKSPIGNMGDPCSILISNYKESGLLFKRITMNAETNLSSSLLQLEYHNFDGEGHFITTSNSEDKIDVYNEGSNHPVEYNFYRAVSKTQSYSFMCKLDK